MKKSIFLMIALVFALLFSAACKDEPKKVVNTAPVTFTKEGTLSILSAETDSLLVQVDIEIAESDYETQTGLMYRESMEKDQGMLFIFPEEAYHSFYMKNTRFPLDIIYINKDLEISSIIANAQPMDEESLPSQNPVMYVLEVNAGLADQWNLSKGDSISFIRIN